MLPFRSNRTLSVLAFIVIAVGIFLRLMIYFKNNNLFMDEVNLAMNIHDRPFSRLFGELDNHQFTPPGFLIILKLFSGLFGYSEYAFRLFPLLCGFVGLGLMYVVLKQFVGRVVVLYPLWIMSVGFIYIRYSTVVKQYSLDICVILSLLLLALKTDINKEPPLKFSVKWMVAGAIAIWFTMPSVFMLASIGIYYLWVVLKSRQYTKLYSLSAIAIFWLLNFGAYYETMLKYQIGSEYLKMTTVGSRLNILTTDPKLWDQNWALVKDILINLGGDKTLSVAFHIAMLFLGGGYLFRKHTGKALLTVLPILFCLVAICLQQYTMMLRVMLFSFPLMLIIIAVGIDALVSQGKKVITLLVIACCLICLVNHTQLKDIPARTENEEITRNMEFALKWNITSENLYVQWAARYAFRYYTTVHPDKARWRKIKDAHILDSSVDYQQLSANFKGRSAILFGWEDWDLFIWQLNEVKKNANEVAVNNVPVGWIFIYDKK